MSARDLARGTLVVHYRIEAVLGRGGVGVVYLAEDLRLKRRVALKVLSPELAEDERFRERFLSESELAASLDHGNVIPVYEAGNADGSLYIAMRYVEGSDLKAQLAEGPLTDEQVVALADQIGGALDAAHERGLVHGDVKPSNVLIDARGHAYLADFGLTKRIGAERAADGDAQLMGTIDYVAPEQIRGEEVDGRADVYSLGCLLYECLTGRQPFKRGNDAATLYAHLEDAAPEIGSSVDPVIARALAKSPDERYQTCAALAEDARVALGVAAPRRSRVPVAIAVVAVLVAAAALTAFFVFRGRESGPSALTGRLVRIDGDRVGASVKVGADPSGLAFGNGRVWVTSRGASQVWGVDRETLTATPIQWSAPPAGIAIDGRTGYVLDDGQSITRLDLGTSTPMAGKVPLPGGEVISGGGAGVWSASAGEVVEVASVSPQVEQVRAHGFVPQPAPDEDHFRFDSTGIAVGPDAVWVTGDALDPRLFRLDPTTAMPTATVGLPFVPSAVAADAHGVWVTEQLDDAVARIDPASNRIVQRIKVGREPMALAIGPNAVWVANALDDTVSRIDTRTNRVTATVPFGAVPSAIAADGKSVWVVGDAR